MEVHTSSIPTAIPKAHTTFGFERLCRQCKTKPLLHGELEFCMECDDRRAQVTEASDRPRKKAKLELYGSDSKANAVDSSHNNMPKTSSHPALEPLAGKVINGIELGTTPTSNLHSAKQAQSPANGPYNSTLAKPSVVPSNVPHCSNCGSFLGAEWATRFRTCPGCQERARMSYLGTKEQKVNSMVPKSEQPVRTSPRKLRPAPPTSLLQKSHHSPNVYYYPTPTVVPVVPPAPPGPTPPTWATPLPSDRGGYPQHMASTRIPLHNQMHFNAQGEIIAPEPPVLDVSMPKVDALLRDYLLPIRTCLTHGCKTKLPPLYIGTICERCVRGARWYIAPDGSQRVVSVDAQYPGHPSLAPSIPDKIVQNLMASHQSPVAMISGTKKQKRDDLDLELKYPGDPIVIGQGVPSIPTLVSQNSSDATRKRAIHNARGKRLADAERTGQVDVQRKCTTDGCSGFIPLGSSWPRCPDCSLKRWKKRLGKELRRDHSKASGKMRREEARTEATAEGTDKLRHPQIEPYLGMEIPTGELEDAHPASNESGMRTQEEAFRVVGNGNGSSGTAVVVPERSLRDSEGATSSANITVLPLSPSDITPRGHDTRTIDEPPLDSPPAGADGGHLSGWDSDLTDLTDDLSDSCDSSEGNPSDESDTNTRHKPTGLTIRIPARSSPISGSSPLLCSIPQCKAPLPMNYCWKLCNSCRTRCREYQRKRLGIVGRKTPDDKDDTMSSTPLYSTDSSSPRMCTGRGCFYVLPPFSEYRWKMCEECRQLYRRRYAAKKERMVLTAGGTEGRLKRERSMSCESEEGVDDNGENGVAQYSTQDSPSHDLTEDSPAHSTSQEPTGKEICKPEPTPIPQNLQSEQALEQRFAATPYPQFQHKTALLAAFESRLSCFLKSQIQYLHLKLQSSIKIPIAPAVFGFDGEFSTVLDPKWTVEEGKAWMQSMKDAVSKKMGILFKCVTPPEETKLDRGLAMRYICAYGVCIPVLRPGEVRIPGPSNTFVKRMEGELEVAVFADNSHRLFPGQRTILRFRLVG